jgi:hypothetical protein
MSDYLGNLIARTVSPAAAVRPQLPSLFEPAPATRQVKREPEFELQSFVEQPLVKESSEKAAPMASSIVAVGQSVLHDPKQIVPDISPAREVLEASDKSDVAVRPRIFSRAAPSFRDEKQSSLIRRKSDVIDSPPRHVVESASCKISARDETQSREPSVASTALAVPELRKHELLNQPGIQPVVQKVQSLTQTAPVLPAVTTAPPTINVTIGRVEVRAVPPPVQQRAKPKQATVLSLDAYLRQRANGDRR